MAFWLAPQPLVLASKSEIRRSVLVAAGLPVEVRLADVDERALERAAAETDPSSIALLLARAKAAVVARHMPGRVVIGADQVLALGEERFSKPADRAEARAQLLRMRGKAHGLHSAVAVMRDAAEVFVLHDTARLTMRTFTDDFLDRYLDAVGGAALTSVGGYQLEGAGIHLFARVEGDHFTILGLPLVPLLDGLRKAGLIAS